MAYQDIAGLLSALGPATDSSGGPPQYDIESLIRQISQPQPPELLPVPAAEGPVRGGLRTAGATIADVLQGLGRYSDIRRGKRGFQPEPGNFLGQLQAERQYRTTAMAENARRTRAAEAKGSREGNLLRLEEAQRQSAEKTKDLAKAEAESTKLRDQAWVDAREYAQKWNVPILDEKGQQKPIAQLHTEALAKAQEAEKGHKDLQARRIANQDKRIEMAMERLGIQKKAAASRAAAASPEDKAMARMYDREIQTARGNLADLRRQRDLSIRNFDEAGAADINSQIEDSLSKLEGLVREASAPTAAQPAKAAPAKGGWSITEIK